MRYASLRAHYGAMLYCVPIVPLFHYSIIPGKRFNVKLFNRFTTCFLPKKIRCPSGFTLLEILISIAIMGIIMVGLEQTLRTAISAYDENTAKQELLSRGRYAMERMAMFIRESDDAPEPSAQSDQEIIKASERVLDTYTNSDNTYAVAGDGKPDADNDGDGILNEDAATPDPPEYVTFDLDKTDSSNWKLQEVLPDYSTGATLDDYVSARVICENVTAFKCNRLDTDLIEIELTLNDGNTEVSLKTRVRSKFITGS